MSKLNSNKDVAQALRGFYDTQVTALNGVIDKLPEGLRSSLVQLKDKLNAQLDALPPIDQVPAAQDAAYAFQSFEYMLGRMQEHVTGVMERLSKLSDSLKEKTVALNGLEEKVTKGELLEKSKVDSLLEKAKNDALASVMPSVVALRKSQIEMCGLPEAPDNVLNLGATEYEEALGQAKKNLGDLKAKGFGLEGKGASWVKKTAWKNATEFAGEMETIKDFVPAAAAAGKTGAADPLLGGKTGDDAEGKQSTKGGRRITMA